MRELISGVVVKHGRTVLSDLCAAFFGCLLVLR
ncbi:hypothetical protein ACVISU_005021 [Bradyrhizobium sp. USDA 4452]